MGKMKKKRKFFKLFSCLGNGPDDGADERISSSSPPQSSVQPAAAAADACPDPMVRLSSTGLACSFRTIATRRQGRPQAGARGFTCTPWMLVFSFLQNNMSLTHRHRQTLSYRAKVKYDSRCWCPQVDTLQIFLSNPD